LERFKASRTLWKRQGQAADDGGGGGGERALDYNLIGITTKRQRYWSGSDGRSSAAL
jgi:hypothetical protein